MNDESKGFGRNQTWSNRGSKDKIVRIAGVLAEIGTKKLQNTSPECDVYSIFLGCMPCYLVTLYLLQWLSDQISNYACCTVKDRKVNSSGVLPNKFWNSFGRNKDNR
jgi:hypothetical protein